jgi:putative ABC transport system substrate-binding protein
MRRRALLAGTGAATFAGAAGPRLAAAQPAPRVRRIALLMTYPEGDPEGVERLAVFRQGLRDAGWREGENLRIELHWLAGDLAVTRVKAREAVEQAPDVIVVNGSPALAAVQALTGTIPIVFIVVADPVGAGYVRSLARPGGNATGFATFEPEIGGKWLDLLREAAPAMRRVGVVSMPGQAGFLNLRRAIEGFARAAGLEAEALDVRDRAEIEAAIPAFAARGEAGLIALPTPANSTHRAALFAVVNRHRLPAIYPFTFMARDGGLMAYGFDSVDLFRRAAPYVARVLAGTPPGELPVQAPTRYELVANLAAARAIGLALPPTLLARADEVIE